MGRDDKRFLPYGRQHVFPEDIEAVTEVLGSDFLTQGPVIADFEDSVATAVDARYAVACTSGTAALHLSMLALGVGPGDRVVTTANTFLADANCARYVGADVAFTDIDPTTGNMSAASLEKLLEQSGPWKRQVVIPVHFAGQPVDLPLLAEVAAAHDATIVDDACHALGGAYESGARRLKVGCGEHSRMTVFSFHPVKHVATGEGGAVTTNDPDLAERLRLFRNHGMQKTGFINDGMAFTDTGETNPWYYEMSELGFNYRITDIQAALGRSQLGRLGWSVRRRNELAFDYHRAIEQIFASEGVHPLHTISGVVHAYHLFAVRIEFERFGVSRADVMNELKSHGIGTQVHYIPVPLQPYYRRLLGTNEGDFPGAEEYYREALSLPMYPDLTDDDVQRVVEALHSALGE